MSIFSASALTVEFGADTLFRDVTFTVEAGDRWGVIGRNGTGKTTLFRLLTGAAEPTSGTVARSSGLRTAMLDQYRDFGEAELVWDAAAGPFAALRALEVSLHQQGMRLGELGERATEADLDRYARDLEAFEHQGGYTLAPRVDAVLHGLGFDPDAARTQPVAQLSGGERGRLALARQLVAPADVLLLDEPTNHLDLDTTRWLEEYLRGFGGTILVISHDRAFLSALVDHVLHLENGTAAAYAASYQGFVEQRAERRLTQERAFSKQQRNIASEEDFIRRNIAGGNSRQAKGRRRRLERLPRLSAPEGEAGVMSVRFDPLERGGDQVAVMEQVRLEVPGRVLLDRFSARIGRGDTIGLIGPNGTGKSTLLKALLGERGVDGGALRLGDSVNAAYYRQDLGDVDPERRLYDLIADLRPTWGRGAVQGHLGRFGFSGDSVLRRAGTLSGGERARMALALMMLSGANFLIFDEPTNHLDVESIEALEDALSDFDGTILLVSHDRALLRSLVDRVWILHGGHITDFPGSFEEWETASAERAHAARVASAEDERSRRVKERRQVRAEPGRKETQAALRRGRRDLEAAETAVAEWEQRVAGLVERLEDPDLYGSAEGTRAATELGTELEAARAELEAAYRRWTAAAETVEELGGVEAPD